MRIAIIVAAAAGLGLAPISTYGQAPAVLQSPSLAKARACLGDLVEAGKKANFKTDRVGGNVLVLNPTRPPLHPLLTKMATCMDAAYPKSEIVNRPTNGVKSRIWYVSVEGYHAWCATNSLTNDLEAIDVLGGHSAERAWYGVHVECSVGDKILGWYTPKS